MSYSTRFLFKFESNNGIDYEIRIGKDGYAGTAVQRPLGQSPVLRREENGAIHGTSLDIYAECQSDEEFTELYTPDPFEYSVDLYSEGSLIWSGFVSPELYSEPDIAPPYNVQITATDGLGELKLSDWEPAATQPETIGSTIEDLLDATGLSLNLDFVSSLTATGTSAADLLSSLMVDLSHLEGKTKYEVLESILDTLHATLTEQDGEWVMVRETDAASLASGSSLSGHKIGTYGRMGSAEYWPVGQLEAEVEPAKRQVIVTAPNHYKSSILNNSDMSKDTGWTKSTFVSWADYSHYMLMSTARAFGPGAYLSQTVTFSKMATALELTAHVKNNATSGMASTFTARFDVLAILKDESGNYYWPKQSGYVLEWEQTSNPNDFQGAGYTNVDVASETDFTYDLPAVPTSYGACELTIYLGHLNYDSQCLGTVNVTSAYLALPTTSNGWQDILQIDNSARDVEDEVQLCLSTIVSDLPYSPVSRLQTGVGAVDDQVNITWSTLHIASMDLLKLMSRDYAMSVAMPRVRKKGKLNVPDSGMMPMFYKQEGVVYMVDTFSWDLLNDEFDMEMVSLPSAAITVESEVTYSNIEQTSDGSYVSGGSGTTTVQSGSGGVSKAELSNYVDISSAQTITGQKTFDNDLSLTAGKHIKFNGINALAEYGGDIYLNFGNGSSNTHINGTSAIWWSLGSDSKFYLDANGLHALADLYMRGNKIYGDVEESHWIEYDETNGAFKINGNVYATGYITAGGQGQDAEIDIDDLSAGQTVTLTAEQVAALVSGQITRVHEGESSRTYVFMGHEDEDDYESIFLQCGPQTRQLRREHGSTSTSWSVITW